ncbi:MAG: hypothetical protein JO022_19340 [Acidobacteriaceae bacterium]|nr:hypothetical protein [Acidobacteriaceae bacterium]
MYRPMIIAWFAVLASFVASVFVAKFVPGWATPAHPGTSASLFGFGMASVGAASFVLRRVQQTAAEQGDWARVRTYFLLTLALFEGWAMCYVMIHFLTGFSQSWLFFGVGLAYLALHLPKKRQPGMITPG